jgi:hypothetical protein
VSAPSIRDSDHAECGGVKVTRSRRSESHTKSSTPTLVFLLTYWALDVRQKKFSRASSSVPMAYIVVKLQYVVGVAGLCRLASKSESQSFRQRGGRPPKLNTFSLPTPGLLQRGQSKSTVMSEASAFTLV